jgi:hypothetical protein
MESTNKGPETLTGEQSSPSEKQDRSQSVPKRTGKRRSRHNAVTHGILADILLDGDLLGESSETYRRMLSALRNSVRPVDDFEELQVQKLAFLYVRLTRVYKADWRLAPKLFAKLEKSVDADHSFVTKGLFV